MLERWTKLFKPKAELCVVTPPPAADPAPPRPGAKVEGHRADWDLWRTPTGSWIDVNRANGTQRVRKHGKVTVFDSHGNPVTAKPRR